MPKLKYKIKYLNQIGGVDYKYYFLHPTNLTSINDSFGNEFLKIKINIINENILKKFKYNDNDYDDYIKKSKYKCIIKNINYSNESNNLFKLFLIIYKLKNKFKNNPDYESLIYIKLNIIQNFFESNKKIIKNYNIYINKLNEIFNDKISIEYLDEYYQELLSLIIKKNDSKQIANINCKQTIDEIIDDTINDTIDENPLKKLKTDLIILITIKIIHIINENGIIILLIYNKIDNDKEYIDFFIINTLINSITINTIYQIIITNKIKISELCINKLIPLNIISILKNNSYINYEENKKKICDNEIQLNEYISKIDISKITTQYQILNYINNIIDNNKLYNMFHAYLIEQIKKNINILNINSLNNFIIVATTLELFYNSNKLYYNNGNSEHAEQLLLTDNNNIDNIYIIKFSYTDSNLNKLLNEQITHNDFNATLITQCGIPCQSCLNLLKQHNINKIFYSNNYGEIIKLDNILNETYTTKGHIFINYDKFLYEKYIL